MIIGISGYKGSGKTTLGRALKHHLDDERENAIIDHLAEGFKRAVQVIFGFDTDQIYGDNKETVDEFWGVSPRWAMQTLGTEWGRVLISKDMWIKSLWVRVRGYHENGVHVIIPDIRFENEAQFVRDNGGILINILRDEVTPGDVHPSELGLTNWSDYDYTVYNNGSIEDLLTRAEEITQSIIEIT